MGIHSRNKCERHRWVEGAWDHWSALWPSSVSSRVAKVHAGSVRLAFIIIVSLLGAFLLGAVGSVSEAEAGVSIVKFDGVSKVHRLRIPVDKSDTIRLEHPFAEVLVGDSEIADIIPLTNQSLYVLGMARYQKNESLEPQGTETSDTFGSEGKPPTPPAP